MDGRDAIAGTWRVNAYREDMSFFDLVSESKLNPSID